jgi:hypothetical protein
MRGQYKRTKKHRAALAARNREQKFEGSRHWHWKGDDVSYDVLHLWVRYNKKKTGVCSHCGRTPEPRGNRKYGTEWANVSGEYRRDLNDFIELCRPCHTKFDERRENAKYPAGRREQ